MLYIHGNQFVYMYVYRYIYIYIYIFFIFFQYAKVHGFKSQTVKLLLQKDIAHVVDTYYFIKYFVL